MGGVWVVGVWLVAGWVGGWVGRRVDTILVRRRLYDQSERALGAVVVRPERNSRDRLWRYAHGVHLGRLVVGGRVGGVYLSGRGRREGASVKISVKTG